MTALLTDLYQLTMLDVYLAQDMQETATFELFVRRLPPQRNFLVAAGLEQVVQYLEALRFEPQEVEWLQSQVGLSDKTADYLRQFRFTGSVHAMREGTVCFAHEPLLRVTAPLPQAQLVESRILNLIHFQTLIASKAARVRWAAGTRPLVDFGMRRAHGAEAALLAARANRLAGFDGTATVEAGRQFGIPVVGTMAHSFVQAFVSEESAFEAYVQARPSQPTLLIDTYDTGAATDRVIALSRKLAPLGLQVGAVRIDSGDLAAHANRVRAKLDAAGLKHIRILVSGNLDEERVLNLVQSQAAIDAFGVGTVLDTSADAPSLEAVYKLQAYAGAPRRKRSEGKATWPGVKQVWRTVNESGALLRDVVALEGETVEDEAVPLLSEVMRGGRRVGALPSLDEARQHHTQEVARLPSALRTLQPTAAAYTVDISAGLQRLVDEVDQAGG